MAKSKDDRPEMPFDILEDIFKFGRTVQRRVRQNEKDKWIAKARALFEPSQRQNCYVCGKHRLITHAHHVIPLANQFALGFEQPDHAHAWLCPNHHAIIHLFLSAASAANNDENFGGVLDGFTRTELRALHELLMKSRGVVVKP